jgi:hypothetical protein
MQNRYIRNAYTPAELRRRQRAEIEASILFFCKAATAAALVVGLVWLIDLVRVLTTPL